MYKLLEKINSRLNFSPATPRHEQFHHRVTSAIKRFRHDERGNFAILTTFLIPPLLLVGMLAMDSANLMRTRNNVQAALDASALAVGKKFATGAEVDNIKSYGKEIFEANLTAITAEKVAFTIDVPDSKTSNQLVEAQAHFPYHSLFGTLSSVLTWDKADWNKHSYTLVSQVKLKNTVEVALVLDNSGSMSIKGTGSSIQRIDLLKTASKQLVQTMANQSKNIKNVEKSVQFSLVPFSASVNIGAGFASAAWMDQEGRSSIHHENFTLPVEFSKNKRIGKKDGSLIYQKLGTGWNADEDQVFTRMQLYKDLQSKTTASSVVWKGCIESRPGIYALNADVPNPNNPDTMFVPMFAPDEVSTGVNHWWNDDTKITNADNRQKDVKKYYNLDNKGIKSSLGANYSCTTEPLTILTDVTDEAGAGIAKITAAIDAMAANGNTNVPEGLVWGWRTLVKDAPFPQARPMNERGNDKVVIVLTDGENTYSNYRNPDDAGNKSTYAAYGYTGTTRLVNGTQQTRIFEDTGLRTTYNTSQYTAAMNKKFETLCDNAKKSNIMLMTVALDLKESTTVENAQIEALKKCSSDSRVRRDPTDPNKPAKLFWNTKGGDLEETFRQIGDELSNLRIVG